MEALENLVKINKLKHEPPNNAEFAGMVAAATTRLQDVSLQGLSTDVGLWCGSFSGVSCFAVARLSVRFSLSGFSVFAAYAGFGEIKVACLRQMPQLSKLGGI